MAVDFTSAASAQITIFHFDPPKKPVKKPAPRLTRETCASASGLPIRRFFGLRPQNDRALFCHADQREASPTVLLAAVALWAVAGFMLAVTLFFTAWHQGRAMLGACLGL